MTHHLLSDWILSVVTPAIQAVSNAPMNPLTVFIAVLAAILTWRALEFLWAVAWIV
jgi:hypothetical protein